MYSLLISHDPPLPISSLLEEREQKPISLSLSAVLGLCCSAQALEHTGSPDVVRGLSCSTACGILVSRPGIKPASPALETWSLNHWATKKVHISIF